MTDKIEEHIRTSLQNKSLHLFFTQLADQLNEAGLDQRKVLKPGIEIPWDSRTIKEQIFRPVMKAQLGKESTTELTTKEVDQVFETLARHLANKFGITIEFPSIETIISKMREKDGL